MSPQEIDALLERTLPSTVTGTVPDIQTGGGGWGGGGGDDWDIGTRLPMYHAPDPSPVNEMGGLLSLFEDVF